MSASKHLKIFIPLVSATSLLALSAQAQEARSRQEVVQPPAGPAAGAPPQANPPMRKGPPPQQATRPAQPGGQPHAGHNAGGPPPGRHVARGPAPTRDWGGHTYRGNLAWEGGRWRHDVRHGRSGWWWDVGGVWYYYPQRMAGPGASALGGALVGGLLGGLISGNATGAAAGAVLGGATGAIAGATAASQPGYYWAQGTCYYRYPNGQYVQADPRACY